MSENELEMAGGQEQLSRMEDTVRPLSGAEAFGEAIDAILREKAQEFAKALAHLALNGQVQCLRFVYEISERHQQQKPDPDAEELAQEVMEWRTGPQWNDEIDQSLLDA